MNQQPFKFKVPSRGTVIFCSVLSAISATIYISKHHATEARKTQCEKVSFLADRPCGVHEMPRKVAVYIMAPPGDSMDKSRAWFHEYIKPILVAGAVDYDVKEGKTKGAIEAAVSEEIIRQRRQMAAEAEPDDRKMPAMSEARSSQNPYSPIVSDVQPYQQTMSMIHDARERDQHDGVLAIGRLAWGELLRGIEKGYHSSLDTADQSDELQQQQTTAGDNTNESSVHQGNQHTMADVELLEDSDTSVIEKPLVLPSSFSSVMYIPHENIIGWTNIPYRIYRWITDCTRITDVGQYAVAAVLNQTRPLEEQDVDMGEHEKRYWIGDDAEQALQEDTPIALEKQVRGVLRTYASEDLP